MFERHIKELERKDHDLNDRVREIDRLDNEMIDLSKKITVCVLSETIDEELLSTYKRAYNDLKLDRDIQRDGIEEIKEEMRNICRNLDNLIGGIKR